MSIKNRIRRFFKKSKTNFLINEDYLTSAKDIKICCIGLGPQGLKVASRFVEMGYEVVGVCDLEMSNLRLFNSHYSKIFSTTDMSDLAELNPNVAILSTLADNRSILLEKLNNLGIKNVICEKPIVNNLEEKDRILDLVRFHKLNIIVNQSPKTWHYFHQDVKDIVQSGVLGSPVKANINFKSKGFGNIGSHYLSLISFILESKIKSVLEANFIDSKLSVKRAKGHNDLNGEAKFLLENDILILVSNIISSEPKLQITFEKGEIIININDFSFSIFDSINLVTKEYSSSYRWDSKEKVKFSYMLDSLVRNLFDKSNEKNLDYSLNSVEAIIAAQHCHKDKKIVDLPISEKLDTINLFS